jgi:heme exporter protein B
MNAWKAFGYLVWKDIKIEFRGKQFLAASATFGVLMLFITGMAMDAAPTLPVTWSAGLLWLNVLFTTAIGLTRHDRKDKEYGAGMGLRLIPVDPSVLYYAKWVSTCAFVLVAQAVLVLAFFVMFNQQTPPLLGTFVLTLIGGIAGLTGIGSFLSTMTAESTMRDLLLPLLLFPISVPLFLAVLKITVGAFSTPAFIPWVWVDVLAGYIVMVAVLPWLLYEILMEV